MTLRVFLHPLNIRLPNISLLKRVLFGEIINVIISSVVKSYSIHNSDGMENSHTWISYYITSYFFGGTWPTLTRTQMTLRVCMPTEQEASLPCVWPTDVLLAGMEESSMQCPHKPVCQWYTVQGWSLQFLTSCRALMLGHWIPPEK